MIIVVGGVVVAIGMVGLVNAITMNVIERTREIGILRCVGARARDIRRAFAAESVVQAVLGMDPRPPPRVPAVVGPRTADA